MEFVGWSVVVRIVSPGGDCRDVLVSAPHLKIFVLYFQ